MKSLKKAFLLTGIVLAGLVLLLASCASMKSDESIAEELGQRIKDGGLTNVDVKATDRGVTITAGALNFPPDSAEIIPETARRLDAIAELLEDYPNKKLLIEGHTADVGDTGSQLSLSIERAQAVADYFVSKGTAKASQMVIEGKGGTMPLGSNDTEEGRAKNRRVEITLLR